MKFDIYRWLTVVLSIRLYYNQQIYNQITYTIFKRIVHVEWWFLSLLKRNNEIKRNCTILEILEIFEKYDIFNAIS